MQAEQEQNPQQKKNKLSELRGKAANQIRIRCNDKVSRVANIIAVLGLSVWSFLRFLWCFGVGAEAAHFNFFFFVTSLYLMSFVVILGFIEFKPDHRFSVSLRTYFNFLNTIIGRGLYLIFLALILVEKSDQGEIVVGVIVIVIGICNIILGWKQEKQEIPDARFQGSGVGSRANDYSDTSNQSSSKKPPRIPYDENNMPPPIRHNEDIYPPYPGTLGADQIEIEVGYEEEYKFDQPARAKYPQPQQMVEIEIENNPRPIDPTKDFQKMESVDLEDPYKEDQK